MRQALEQFNAQQVGMQDYLEGKDTPAARAYREQTETMQKQSEAMERERRKDPAYVRMQEEGEQEYRESLRRNPSGLDSEFNLSDVEEAELGFGMAEQFLSNQRLIADPGLQRYINSVGLWIARQSERPGLPWRFAVIEGEAPNAFAVPGGYVFLTRGMLELIETESELAGVLGHEVAHVVRKHHLRWVYLNKEFAVSIQRAQETLGKTNAATQAVFQQMGKAIQRSIDQLNTPVMRANLSRSEELQADTDGAILAWRAGYEVWGLMAVLQRFEAVSRTSYAGSEALAGHPEPLQRLKMLDFALRSRPQVHDLGESLGERFQKAVASGRRP